MSRSGRAYHLLCRIPIREAWKCRRFRKHPFRRHVPLRELLNLYPLCRGWR
jgi:hypothetical protein